MKRSIFIVAILVLTVLGQKACAFPAIGTTSAGVATEPTMPREPRTDSPHLERVSDRVVIAVGYDVANVAAIQTDDGVVIVDTSSSTLTAQTIRNAFRDSVKGPIRAVIYTHGDIEQTGGGGSFVEPGTEIWGTTRLAPEFLRRCILLQQSELRRGIRQFTLAVDDDRRPESAWGPLPQFAQLEGMPNLRLPTRTFDDKASFTIGGVGFELFAAPGETPEHLAIWIPSLKVLLVGDNFVRGFPALGSLRGTPQHTVEQWIASLDLMRKLNAETIISARHNPVRGAENVAEALTHYRDAIQWVRDETVRAINRGESVDALAETISLPPHLQKSPWLDQSTGAIAWGARALYAMFAGWFDEQVDLLIALPTSEAAAREIDLMGGPERVLTAARDAREKGENAWAIHLLRKLQRAQPSKVDTGEADEPSPIEHDLAEALDAYALTVQTTDARGYLTSIARELRRETRSLPRWACPEDESLAQVPIETFFEAMKLRLKPEETANTFEQVRVHLDDEDRDFYLAIRHGVLEVVEGHRFTDSPPLVAVFATDSLTWRKLCMCTLSGTAAVLSGRMKVEGKAQAVRRFARYFQAPNEFEREFSGGPKLEPAQTAAD